MLTPDQARGHGVGAYLSIRLYLRRQVSSEGALPFVLMGACALDACLRRHLREFISVILLDLFQISRISGACRSLFLICPRIGLSGLTWNALRAVPSGSQRREAPEQVRGYEWGISQSPKIPAQAGIQ